MNNKLSIEGGDGAPVRLVLIAGFLGAGKTAAAAQFAHFLRNRGKIAAVITNDHGAELVDSTTLDSQGIPTEPLQGGALCGRQEEFVKIANRLVKKAKAGVLIAEPIGTCSSLAGDFLEPLKRSNPNFTFAPLSVLVDPLRARQMLKSDDFNNAAAATFRNQLAEADFIVINKADRVPARELAELRADLTQYFPSARIFTVSTVDGAGLEEWFECIMSKDWSPRLDAAVQRDAQGAGDSSISWLNCTILLSSMRYFEAGRFLVDLATCVQSLLKQEAGEIVHLKMVLKPDHDAADIASLSLVQPESAPKLLRDVSEPIQRGELFLSARAESDPEVLHSVLNRALLALMERSSQLFARMQHCEHFRPGNSGNRKSTSAASP